jgi:hypothetical protein
MPFQTTIKGFAFAAGVATTGAFTGWGFNTFGDFVGDATQTHARVIHHDETLVNIADSLRNIERNLSVVRADVAVNRARVETLLELQRPAEE